MLVEGERILAGVGSCFLGLPFSFCSTAICLGVVRPAGVFEADGGIGAAGVGFGILRMFDWFATGGSDGFDGALK